jgi:poly-gamma-glutamate capsule biosynthesis protein CapA/YwtB (metallophosphatase superfamily)
MRGFNRPCDVIVASIHWGGNWGYRTRDEEIRFAHQLIEHGIAVVHGHYTAFELCLHECQFERLQV